MTVIKECLRPRVALDRAYPSLTLYKLFHLRKAIDLDYDRTLVEEVSMKPSWLRIPFEVAAAILVVYGSAAATTIHVPADQPTIQAAINAATNGDTVLVSAGTYPERINFLGKAITVRGISGRRVTWIDGGGSGTVVTFNSGEKLSSVLRGFTIIHGVSANAFFSG